MLYIFISLTEWLFNLFNMFFEKWPVNWSSPLEPSGGRIEERLRGELPCVPSPEPSGDTRVQEEGATTVQKTGELSQAILCNGEGLPSEIQASVPSSSFVCEFDLEVGPFFALPTLEVIKETTNAYLSGAFRAVSISATKFCVNLAISKFLEIAVSLPHPMINVLGAGGASVSEGIVKEKKVLLYEPFKAMATAFANWLLTNPKIFISKLLAVPVHRIILLAVDRLRTIEIPINAIKTVVALISSMSTQTLSLLRGGDRNLSGGSQGNSLGDTIASATPFAVQWVLMLGISLLISLAINKGIDALRDLHLDERIAVAISQQIAEIGVMDDSWE